LFNPSAYDFASVRACSAFVVASAAAVEIAFVTAAVNCEFEIFAFQEAFSAVVT